MRYKRIREFAKPLSEARKKDEQVDKAAVFVEKLFGRELKSNPDLMIINSDNATEIRSTLKDEYPNAVVVSMPWAPKVNIEALQEEYPSIDFSHIKFAEFRLPELLTPPKLLGKINDTAIDFNYRAIIEHLSSIDDPRFVQKLARMVANAVFFSHLGMIVVSEKGVSKHLVHELIHAEDHAEFGLKSEKFKRMVAEGRATFGQKLFQSVAEGTLEPVKYMNDSSFLSYTNDFVTDPMSMVRMMKRMGPKKFAKWLKDVYDITVAPTNLNYQLVYLPIAVQLVDLGIAVKDPYKGFQIATAKPPEKLSHLFKPREYYAEEIAKHKRKE